MRNLAYLLVVGLLFGMSFQSTAQLPSPISLEELQDLARQRALDVLIADRDRSVAEMDLKRLDADLKPQVRLNATVPSYFSSFRETIQPDGTVRFQPVNINNSSVSVSATQAFAKTGGTLALSTGLQRFDDFEQNFNLYNGSVVRLGYNQPIFGFNPFKWRKEIAPMRAAETNAAHKAAQEEAALSATQLFFNLANADLSFRIADSNAVASERLLTIANERYELGKVSRGDLVQLELDLVSARQNRLRAGQVRILATTAIYSLLGTDFDGEAIATVSPVLPEGAQVNVDEALQKSKANRPEAFAKIRRILEAEAQLDADKKNNGFQANLTASIGLIRSDPSLAEVYANPQTEQVVELGLSVPLVDWGRRKAILRQSEAELFLAKAIGDRATNTLETQVRLAVAQYNQAQQELELLESVRDLAQERYQISRESYLLGAVPLTELTLAQQARDQRLRQYLGGLENAWTAYAQLNALTLGAQLDNY